MHTSIVDAAPPHGVRLSGGDRLRLRLVTVNAAVLVALVLHDLDHLRQASGADYDIPVRLFAGNAAVYVPTLVALALSWRLGRRAREWTIVSAALWLVGFIVVHLIGAGAYYGYWATPYPRLGVDALSWLLYAIPVATFLGAGWIALRTPRPPA